MKFATPYYWLLTLLLCMMGNSLSGQQTLTGEVLDDQDEPLIGVTILIKGTNRGTVTDFDGKYVVECSPGQTLIISYTGYPTTETVLTAAHFRQGKKRTKFEKKEVKPITSSAYLEAVRKDRDTLYIPVPVGEQFRLKKKLHNYQNLKNIKITEEEVELVDHVEPWRYRVELSQKGSFSFIPDRRLPKIQTRFAGGNQVDGVFSLLSPNAELPQAFGPEFSDLGYDGIATAVNPAGQLVPATGGNGVSVNTSPPDIFPTVFLSTTGLSTWLLRKNEEIRLSLKNQTGKDVFGVRPYQNNRISLDLKKRFNKSILTLKGSLERNRNEQANRNGLSNGIYQFAYQSPTEFPLDFMPNRTQNITATEGNFDNPFYLLDTPLDRLTLTRWNLGATWRGNNYDINYNHFDVLLQTNISGSRQKVDFFPGANQVGNLTSVNQDYKLPVWQNRLEANYQFYEDFTAKLLVKHRFEKLTYRYENENLGTQLIDAKRNDLDLVTQFLYNNYKNDLNGIIDRVQAYNQIFISAGNQQKYFLPGVSFRLSGEEWIDNDVLNDIFLSGEFSRSVFQQPFLYQNRSWNYSNLSVFGQADYLVFPELLVPQNLDLETRTNLVGNLLIIGFDDRIFFNTRYYNSRRKDVIGHRGILTETRIEKLANLTDQSLEFELRFQKARSWQKDHNFRAGFIFELNRSKVTAIRDGGEAIIFGGNADVQQVLALGESSGAIRGTTWLRNENGDQIIDEAGYPMVNNEFSIIGDALPDFRMKLNLNYVHEQFSAGINLMYSKGGEAWNGTLASLDFLGLSQNSADLRGTSDFIFPGVTVNGTPNTTPVDFGVSNGVDNGNRWQRYGPGGVGEDNVEDASYLTLSNIFVNYKFRVNLRPVNEISLRLYANNLVSWLPFAGFSPHRTFRDLDATTGIQLFNLPMNSEVGFTLMVKL